ncbi:MULTISPECIES: hypothetical protein [Chitinophaga]|nr:MULTISPECIES: hypothetical protein [Chitinophaga]
MQKRFAHSKWKTAAAHPFFVALSLTRRMSRPANISWMQYG